MNAVVAELEPEKMDLSFVVFAELRSAFEEGGRGPDVGGLPKASAR